MALSKLPADVGDENGETTIDERKIRIKPLPAVSATVSRPSSPEVNRPSNDVGDVGCVQRRLVIYQLKFC